MNITRGLKSAIINFTGLEQQLITKVAEKLEANGFPIHQLTRVHLKKRITDPDEYYTYNEIIFLINPGIYTADGFQWGIESIGVNWEDPFAIRTQEGGIESTIGNKVKPEMLEMVLSGLQDSYAYTTCLQNSTVVLNEINKILLSSDLHEIRYFALIGIPKLIKNYLIVLTTNKPNEGIYDMAIRRLNEPIIDSKYFSELFLQYRLRIHLKTFKIEVLDRFDPTLFPTPYASDPNF